MKIARALAALAACAAVACVDAEALDASDARAPDDPIDASPGAWVDGALDARADADAAGELRALCGDGCDPDWTSACADAGASADAGSPDDGGGLPFPGDASVSPPAAPPPTGCHVRRGDAGPAAVCEPAGEGGLGAPCAASTDCAAGLGCVVADGVAACAPFCCGDPEGCPAATYCAEAVLADDRDAGAPLGVPACARADGCTLLEPAACPSGLACGVVRADGTTSCVTPGAGRAGERCPCADGFVCARSTGTCLALCRTGDPAACPGGTCQGAATGLPPGFGACVVN